MNSNTFRDQRKLWLIGSYLSKNGGDAEAAHFGSNIKLLLGENSCTVRGIFNADLFRHHANVQSLAYQVVD